MNRLTAEELDQLEDYACLEGTEVAAYIFSLMETRQFDIAHGMSEGFSESLNNELRFWLDRFKNETTIEVTTHEVTKTVEERELVWYDV